MLSPDYAEQILASLVFDRLTWHATGLVERELTTPQMLGAVLMWRACYWSIWGSAAELSRFGLR
jgi:uncharacterized membrane protein YdcZ (DUF606 family)